MKLNILKTLYLVEDNAITCKIQYKIKFKDNIYNKPVKKKIYEAKGYAVCNNADKFDFEFGKKIALARAESKAYNDHRKICNYYIKLYNNRLEEIQEFRNKAMGCIEHNEKYIKELSK